MKNIFLLILLLPFIVAAQNDKPHPEDDPTIHFVSKLKGKVKSVYYIQKKNI